MNRLLLDTSAYSALRRGHSGILGAMQDAEEVYMSPIVLGELQSGFLGGERGKTHEADLRTFLGEPRVSIAQIGAETALRYAEIIHYLRRMGRPIPSNDAWIAASAMEHGFHVLTTDAHFQRIPQVSVIYHPRLP